MKILVFFFVMPLFLINPLWCSRIIFTLIFIVISIYVCLMCNSTEYMGQSLSDGNYFLATNVAAWEMEDMCLKTCVMHLQLLTLEGVCVRSVYRFCVQMLCWYSQLEVQVCEVCEVKQCSYVKITILCSRNAWECLANLCEALGGYSCPYQTVAIWGTVIQKWKFVNSWFAWQWPFCVDSHRHVISENLLVCDWRQVLYCERISWAYFLGVESSEFYSRTYK